MAERAVDELLRTGFANGDISVLLPDEASTRDFAHEKNTKAPEGATLGVTAGGAAAPSAGVAGSGACGGGGGDE